MADRVQISDKSSSSVPQKSLADFHMEEVLPTPEVREQFVSDLVYIIPRMLVRYLPVYKAFKIAVVHHIPHEHTQEMSKKSEYVRNLKQVHFEKIKNFSITKLKEI